MPNCKILLVSHYFINMLFICSWCIIIFDVIQVILIFLKMKLKEKRKCQQQNYVSKQQKVFKPFDRSWIEVGTLHSNWGKCT